MTSQLSRLIHGGDTFVANGTSSPWPYRINGLDFREIRSYSVGSHALVVVHVAGIIFIMSLCKFPEHKPTERII